MENEELKPCPFCKEEKTEDTIYEALRNGNNMLNFKLGVCMGYISKIGKFTEFMKEFGEVMDIK